MESLLLGWTIEQCLHGGIKDIYISSDSDEILSVSVKFEQFYKTAPDAISNDNATSEVGLLHALDYIELNGGKVDWVIAPQVTSPIREASDIWHY